MYTGHAVEPRRFKVATATKKKAKAGPAKPRLLNKREACERIGCSKRQIEDWRYKGYFDRIGQRLGFDNGAVRVGKNWHFREAVIDEIVANGLPLER